MSALIENTEHWRARADQARSMAERLSDREDKRTLLDIARSYDQLAEHAEVRATAKATPRGSKGD
jgi:hypothetical protein